MSDIGTIQAGDLLTVLQVAALLQCKPSTIRAWFTQGRLRRIKVGRLTRILRRDVDAFILSGRTQAKPDER
jgi:excisionase family DNA binding protein